MSGKRPVIAVTMGDAAGIGPEVIAKTLAHEEVYEKSRPLVIGDLGMMRKAVRFTDSDINVRAVSRPCCSRFEHGFIDLINPKRTSLAHVKPGIVSEITGRAAFEYVRTAIELAKSKEVDATVTAPLNKEALHMAGINYSGHTEIYACLTGTKDYAMLLAEGNLRVAHVSTHVSLKKACDLVKKERILTVSRLACQACRKMGIETPRIGVAGLNPHCGENGLFGTEEKEEIDPAVRQAVKEGMNVEGPIPADTVFSKAMGGMYDVVVAMYHDQGHIPVKVSGFNWKTNVSKQQDISGVNITLGLPVVRVSVDHGTACDIAGKGIASEKSMLQAIDYAVKLV